MEAPLYNWAISSYAPNSGAPADCLSSVGWNTGAPANCLSSVG
jgi:hypothetical protein